MKSKILLLVVLVIAPGNLLNAQETGNKRGKSSQKEFTESGWRKIEKRWDSYQPRVILITRNNDSVSGQLLFVDDSLIYVYPESRMITEIRTAGDLLKIPLARVNKVTLKKGGPPLGGVIAGGLIGGGVFAIIGVVAAQGYSIILPVVMGIAGAGAGAGAGYGLQKKMRKSTFYLHRRPAEYGEYSQKLKISSVFRDSLIFSPDIHRLTDHSRILRRTFPDKHFRISAAVNMGSNPLLADMREVFSSSDLPVLTGSGASYLQIEFLDLSWRFRHRFVAGGQFFLNTDTYASFWYNNYDQNINYFYDIQMNGGMLYLDYVIGPVTRFFTKPYEFTAGAGVLFGSPTAVFSYSYIPESTGEWSSTENNVSKNIMGVQLRGGFYYYLSPGFSLSAGLAGNLYQKLNVEALELPVDPPEEPMIMPAHKLNFNSVRFKVGVNVYF